LSSSKIRARNRSDNSDPVTLTRILEAQAERAPLAAGAVSRFVAPRLGTISPWASKAGELLRGAGQPVKRVERGTRIDLTGFPEDAAARAAIARILHDPMTQSLLADPAEAAALFTIPARGAVEVVPLAELERANARLGLALAEDEIEYLRTRYAELGQLAIPLRLFRNAFDDRKINFLHPPRLEQIAKCSYCAGTFAEQQNSCRIGVEAMDELEKFYIARTRPKASCANRRRNRRL
jgi:hypothetical protein